MRRLLGLVLLLLIGCGGAPRISPTSTKAPKVTQPSAPAQLVAAPGIWGHSTPVAVAQVLDAMDGHMGKQGGGIAAGWRQLRARLDQVLGNLGAASGGFAERLNTLGIKGDAPLWISAGSASGTLLGRHLLAAIQGKAVARIQAPIWHVRVDVGVSDAKRFDALLARLAKALNLRAGDPTMAPWSAVKWPKGTRFLARDEQTGTMWGISVRGERAILDVVRATGPDAMLEAYTIPMQGKSAPPKVTAEGVQAGIRLSALAGLETALQAARVLRPRTQTPPQSTLITAAELASACAERWQLIGAVAPELLLGLRGGPEGIGITVDAPLTAVAAPAWASAVRPWPIKEGPDAGYRLVIALARKAFIERLPPLGAVSIPWLTDANHCAVGHPVVLFAAAVPLLPALIDPHRIGVPGLPAEVRLGDVEAMATWIGRHESGGVPSQSSVIIRTPGPALPDLSGTIEVQAVGQKQAVLVGHGGGALGVARTRLRPECTDCKTPSSVFDLTFNFSQLAKSMTASGGSAELASVLGSLLHPFAGLTVEIQYLNTSIHLEGRLLPVPELDQDREPK